MTRGRRGSLRLHRTKLPFATPRRFRPAHGHPDGHLIRRTAAAPDPLAFATPSRVNVQSARPWMGITISGNFGSSVATQIEPERVPRESRSGDSATSMRKVALESKGAFASSRAGTSVRTDAIRNSPTRFLTRIV